MNKYSKQGKHTSSVEPSEAKGNHNLFGRPYLWLTVAAFWEIAISAILLLSVVSNLRFSIWMEGPGLHPAVVFAPSVTSIPFLVFLSAIIGGGILIFIKRKVGLHLSIAGLSSYLIYFYAYWQSVVWDLPNPFYGSGAYLHLFLLLPPLASLLIGWKKVKW